MAARLPGRKTGQPKERGRNKVPMLLCVTRKISRNALAEIFMASYQPDAPARPSSRLGLAGASG